MSKNLVIVESPSKAKTIMKYLGKDYKVIASMGHVIDLPVSRLGIDIENNFKPQYSTMKGKTNIIKEIKKEAENSDKVYLASDPDREGEAIAWHISNALKLDINGKNRITFNEITKEAVSSAIKSPRSIDIDLVDSQQARRILDRIVGYKISPILWKKVKKGLSAGRVQSVALRVIVDKENEINSFIPEEYWNLQAILVDKKTGKEFASKYYGVSGKKEELKKAERVNEIVKEIEGKDFKVVQVKQGTKKRSPAPPFVTSTLQQEASRKLGFTIKKTMMVAQNLYEQGYITYMRTDSVRLSEEAKQMAKDYILNNYGKEYYENRNYKTKSESQDAHEAIRPSNSNVLPEDKKAEMTNDMYKLYKLIFNRFIASQMSNAIYDTMNIEFEVEKYTFKSSGSRIKFPGFMALYIESKDDEDEEGEEILPLLEKDELVKQKELNYEQKFTEPPNRYTEASLVKFLEEKGIGRPSTYAPTINTILDREYIIKEGKYLIPTELGKVVNNIMVNNFKQIVDIEFTASMEEKLDKVEIGKEDYIKMLKEFYNPFVITLEEASEKIEKVTIAPEVSKEICEKCGSNMVIRSGRFGKFLACPNYPECKNTKPYVQSIDVRCPKCEGKVIVRKSKKGRAFYICENNPDKCDYISWTKPSNKKSKNKEKDSEEK